MTSIAFPLGLNPNAFLLRMGTVQRANGSPFGGSEQVVDLLNDRWYISMTVPGTARAHKSAPLEAYCNAMRGMTNTTSLWHMKRTVPRGSMRGSPTCGAASQGAASVTLTTTAGATLFAGDMLGIAGLLLMVAADATANGSGVMTVTLVNRLRTAITGGTAVVWDRPSVPFRLMSATGVQFVPGFATETSLEYAEVIS